VEFSSKLFSSKLKKMEFSSKIGIKKNGIFIKKNRKFHKKSDLFYN